MTTWLGVWTRAVVGPAAKRAGAVWVGCAIIAAVIFGPTAMHPRDLTGLVLHGAGAAIVVGGTWILLFAPIARVLVRADEASYLRSLPGSRAVHLVRAAAMIVLQLPWLALWLVGEGALGLVPVAATTLVATVIAAWRPRVRMRGAPTWGSSLRALVAIYASAVRRRAGEALVRGAGLALFAGLAGGLFVRNNHLVGAEAAKLATIVVVLVCVPAQAGVLGTLLAAHRQSAWLAHSLGIPAATRAIALAGALAIFHVGAALLAMVGVALVSGVDLAMVAAITSTAIASAIAAAAVILRAQHSENAATRLASGAFSAGAAIAVLLVLLEIPAGPLAAMLGAAMLLARQDIG